MIDLIEKEYAKWPDCEIMETAARLRVIYGMCTRERELQALESLGLEMRKQAVDTL